MLVRQRGLRPLRPEEAGERVRGSSSRQRQQARGAVEDKRRAGLSAAQRALRMLQPALGVVEAALAHQEVPTEGERRRGDRIGRPPMGLRQRDRPLGKRERVGDREPRQSSREPEVAEARDLDVRASGMPRQLEGLLEVAARVVGPKRPQLGDAEVQERDRAIVAAQRALASPGVARAAWTARACSSAVARSPP
jgi:hypothetical protein